MQRAPSTCMEFTDDEIRSARILIIDADETSAFTLDRMLKDAGGIPAHGNQRSEWDAGCRFDFANPEYR